MKRDRFINAARKAGRAGIGNGFHLCNESPAHRGDAPGRGRSRQPLEHDPEKWVPVFGKIMLKQTAKA